ncbi:beta-N-acetylhexosaminidase [Deminuibacter soli]|uniref:beta-N-acetylhexosaminidase n=1 Tax=Deminuibacter soli TaxID=2291815 RepID=A0A3E1NID3_9BACT|nr:beta-N-acetylhexosaminidase [Deminuibacter soli]RFM27682.1 beta-N-acetylhexosaminidase [Deminuibacter soli]
MKKTMIAACLLLASQLFGQSPVSIIPAPVKLTTQEGNFILTPSTVIVNTTGEEKTIRFFNDYLQKFYGFKLKEAKKASRNFIELTTPTFIKAPDNAERYTMNVTPDKISITGDSHQGTFYGMQTLLQLLPVEDDKSLNIPAVDIEDYPRFGYRGMMLDVGRHFFSVDFVKQYIDFLALHKINTFHWHLTEDQGWRIEIKKYPKLTQVGSCRNGTITGHHPGNGNDNEKHCGYYTQAQVKEIVKYATDRFVTVIPEIELPGHSSAAIAAYPQLSCFPDSATPIHKGVTWSGSKSGKQVQQSWGVYEDVYCPSEYTFKFLQDVLDEVIALFPSKYIHIGGDECPKDYWKKSAFCQQLIKDNNLKDEHGLQSYFIQRIEKYINSKGRQIIGWDEILEGGLAPNATVMSWRGEKGGIEAASQNHDVIMTPGEWMYIDHAQKKNEDSLTIGGFLSLAKVYSYNPIPAALSAAAAKHVRGAQANLWTEYISNPAKVEYMIFPRMEAVSEVLWSPQEARDLEGFKTRLGEQFKRYDLWKVTYYPNLNEPLNK